jgi:electron transport complex protein RnfC
MFRLSSMLEEFAIGWGVHPHARKNPVAGLPIEVLPLAQHFHVPLQQHIGAPAKPLVKVGQRVRKGDPIARGQGNISAPVHAPTSGHISAIGEFSAPHPSGLPTPAISLEADGADEWTNLAVPDDPFSLSQDEIAGRVAAAGIVGMGGATFPSAVKLSLGRRTQVEQLILNGGECEPYLSCDDRLMRERAAEVIDGARIMQYAIGARVLLVAIENNKPEAIAAMRSAAQAFGDIDVRCVPSRYPMGSEKQLIHTLVGKEVPPNARPMDVGVVLHNVGTAYAVHRALRLGQPLISRIVTVNGGAVAAPRNLEVRIGTLVRDLFDYCGGLTQDPARIVMGGPMMGQQLPNVDVPVIKGTSGVLALTRQETPRAEPTPCIRCATCVGACPIGLMPLEMAAYVRAGDLNGALGHGLKDCIACGTCAYACPAHIPLVHYFDHAKGELAARERAKLKQEATRKLTQARAERQDREAREKAEAAAARKAAKQAAKAAAATAAAPADKAEGSA